jgi:hypothetical protein
VIFIVISIDIRPEKRDDFLAGITRYCAQVRAEPGNRRFTCSEDVGRAISSSSWRTTLIRPRERRTWPPSTRSGFFGWLPSVVSRVPSIVYQELPGGAGRR